MMVDMMGPKGRGVAVGVSECTFYSSVATFAKIFAEVRAVRQSRVWLGCSGWGGGVGGERMQGNGSGFGIVCPD